MAVNKKRGKKRRATKREWKRIENLFSIFLGTTLFVAFGAEVWYRVRMGDRHHVSFVIIWVVALAAVWIGLQIAAVCQKLLRDYRKGAKH